MNTIKILITAGLLSLTLVGCQSMNQPTVAPITATINQDSLQFTITGKIGVMQPTTDGKQAGSAFYAWNQDDDRFAIDLTGAFGIGATAISYDGNTATLTSERTGSITADTPEDLLYHATGWQAPISQLPYWIMGRSTPSDISKMTDEKGRLITAKNDAWTCHFIYDGDNKHPDRLRITHTDGTRITLTINHQA
ncbi:lipoprotein insertase outer membrane protein LolB [Moraxella nasovis]|uniref:lipoprotein insertase outer membrane protein LolB n=1 Tax=Moraxella nasovis TaxID=2904121 RepID=UPI001F604B7D|nr:lipoprotein insertase outer membrane protein LolB [Moraxella nasovis]UNU72791.1 lipoprotein insertase outer membrane protein LolB [Moraxella nasovis]